MTIPDSSTGDGSFSITTDSRRAYAVQSLDRQRRLAFRKGIYPRYQGMKHKRLSTAYPSSTDRDGDDYDERSAWRNRPGIARSKTGTGRSKYDPQPMNRVVREMTKSLGWERRISVASIAARWSEIIGAVNAEHCVVETFDDSILVIRTSSTAWANQMKILLPVVERRISEELGDGVVEKIVIRGPAAPSWKRGQWSVKGRGPRDTYG